MAKRSRKRAAAREAGYRSAFEQSVAEAAEEEGLEFDYEPEDGIITWTPMKAKKYLPDFILPNGIIVEAKGRLTVHDRTKHLAISAQHPELDIRFVFQYDNKLTRTSKSRYSEWADRHGFKWAMKTIPLEWWEE